MRNLCHQRGFTLVELLVTIAVAGILLAIAVPNFRTFLQDSRAISQANLLVQALNVARSEAIKRDVPIDVCPSANGTTCGGTWAQGWIVADRVGTPPFQSVRSFNGSLAEANAKTIVSFLPSGLVTAGATFTLCDDRGATKAREVEVNQTGRIASSPTPGLPVSTVPIVCP